MTNAALRGKPDAGNPHVAPTLRYGGTGRFDEGEVAPAKPRRGSLLYKVLLGCGMIAVATIMSSVVLAATGAAAGSLALMDCEIKAGEPVRPILVAGVLARDYCGERAPSAFSARADELWTELDASVPKIAVCEDDAFSLCGMEGVWRMCETPPPVYTTGCYGTLEKESVGVASVSLASAAAQKVVLRLREGGRLAVFVNGGRTTSTDLCPKTGQPVRASDVREPGDPKVTWTGIRRKRTHEHGGKWRNDPAGDYSYRLVTVSLEPGTNVIVFARAQVSRYTSFTFACALESSEAPVRAILPCKMPPELREAVAQSRAATYLEDDFWMEGECPRLHVGRLASDEVAISVSLYPNGREPKQVVSPPTGEEWIAFPQADSGGYRVNVEWKTKDGRKISSADFTFRVRKPEWPRDPGPARFAVRRQKQLEAAAKDGSPLALYRLGRVEAIATKPIVEKCRKIERLADCADFELLPLLWLAWEDRSAHKLPKEVTDAIRTAALKFRYWVDEPGTSSMYYCSENHRIGFHVCEYIAGILYPTDLFELSQQKGLYHSLKGRMHLMEWLAQRCKFGFDEPLSDAYMPVTLTALLPLYEVLDVDEYPLRNMTTAILDFMTYTFAVASFDGGMGAPRSRSYNPLLRSRTACGHILWLLFGETPASGCHEALACSLYTPPAGVLELAGLKEPADFSFRQGLMHFDKHNVDFVLRRTADYFIGGAREHNEGIRDMHFTPMMVCLKKNIPIFFQSCDSNASGTGFRPDFWAGNAALPRVLPYRRTLVTVWHGVANREILYTHCHFPKRRFDEVVREGGWTFGRAEKGYVGVWSDVPHEFETTGEFAYRELRAPGRETMWLVECGSEREDGSFAEFRQRLLAGTPTADEKGLTYVSPFGGKIEVGREKGFLVDGRDVPVCGAMAESPYFHASYGGGRFDFKCPNFNWTEWTYPACE